MGKRRQEVLNIAGIEALREAARCLGCNASKLADECDSLDSDVGIRDVESSIELWEEALAYFRKVVKPSIEKAT